MASRRVADIKLDVGRDLIVAAAAGVQLAADVAEPGDQCLFDVGVDVFQLNRKRELATLDLAANRVESGSDLGRLVGCQKADLGEHPGMGLAGEDVMLCKTVVEADRLGESLNTIVGAAGEAAAPGFLGHGNILTIISAMSDF